MKRLNNMEDFGGFAWEPVTSVGCGFDTADLNSIAYTSQSGNMYFGRERTNNGIVNLVGGASIANTATLNPYNADHTPSYFVIGFNMKKLLEDNPDALSGLNLQNTSGTIGYEIKFSSSPSASYTMCVAVRHNRFIQLSGSSSNVVV
jgi:hypothetical protein